MRGMPRPSPKLDGDRPDDWRESALCKDEDPELWFPLGHISPSALYQAEQAKSICYACSVRFECLEDVLNSGDSFGIRAGFDEQERLKTHPDTLRRLASETQADDGPNRVVGRLAESCA